jgi:hypothetical protein
MYDLFVPGIFNRWIWGCTTPHIEINHHCLFTSESPCLELMDLSVAILDCVSNRVARYGSEQGWSRAGLIITDSPAPDDDRHTMKQKLSRRFTDVCVKVVLCSPFPARA